MALRGQGSLQLLLGKSVFGAKKRKAGKEEPNTATKRQQTFAEQLDLPAPPDGSGWLRIEAAVVGLRFRRASSAAAVAAVAATAVPSHPSAAAAAADSTVHRMNSWPPVQGHQYRLVPEPTNPQDVNAVQVLLCTTTAGSSSGGPSATPPAAANGAAHLGPLLRAGQLETQAYSPLAGGQSLEPVYVWRNEHSMGYTREGHHTAMASPGYPINDDCGNYFLCHLPASARLRGCGVGAEAADSRDADGGQKSGDVAGLRGGTAGGGGAAGPREGSGADGATAATEAALEAAVAAAAAWRLARSSPNTAAGEVLRSNFATMAADVRRHDGHLLTSLELGLLDRLQGLPPPAQCLFLRLLLRRGPWFTLRGITYLECGDVAVAAEALVAAELAVRPQPEDWPQVAELLPVAERVQRPTGCRMRMVVQAPVTPVPASAGAMAPLAVAADCAAEVVEAMVGPCIRLSPPSLELLARMQRLYFLAEGPAADLGRFLATERGVIRYPTYTINRSSSAFTCRQQLLEYEQALDHAAQLESCLEAGDDAGVAAALAPALAAVRAGAHRLVRWRGDATIPVRAVPGPWPWEAAPTAGCAAADVKDGSMACPTGAASGDDGGMSDGAGGPQVRGSAEPQAPAGMSSGTALTAVAKASCTCHSDGSFAENRSAGGGDSGMRRGDDPWVGGEGQCLRCGGGKRAPPPPPSGAGCGVLESVDLTYSSDDEGGGDGVEMENGGDTVTPAAAVMSTGPCRRGAAAAVAVGAVVAKAVAAAAMEAAASVKPAAQGKEEVAALGLRTEHVVQQAMQGHFPVVQVAGYADGRRVGACQKQPPLGEVGGQTPEEANRDVGTVIDVGVDVGVNLSVGHDGGGVAGILQPAGGGGEDDIMYGDEYDILYTTDCGGVSPGNTAAANPNSDACRQQQQQQLDGEVGPRDDAHQVSPDRQEPSSRLDVEPIPGEMQERTQQPQPQPQPQQFLARFCAAWVYASMTTVGDPPLPSRVGLRVSFLERHRRYGEAVAEAALTDPWVRHGDRLALQRRVLRLGKPPRRWRRPPWAAAALAEPREVVVSGHMLRGRTGLKSRFLAPSAQSVAASSAAGTNPPGPAPARPSAVGAAGPAAASPLVTVEQLALLHYCSPAGGGWRGVHSEGGVWVTMWALLCWDVLFMDVPEVFRNPFQTSPLDLDTDAFLPARRAAVDERLQLIASGGGPELLRSVWSRHAGTWCRGVHWGRLPLGELLQIARCVGGLGLSVVCRRLCEDAGGWRGGMPDLLLWRPERGDAMVSEVKGPRDRLSDQQRAWLAALAAAGVRAEVLRVVEAAPPPRRHADHGAQQRDAEGAVDAAVPAAVAVADVAAAAAAAPAAVAALTGDLGGGGARAGRRVLLRGRRAAAAVPIACEGVAAKRPEDHPAVASFGVGAALAVPAAGASLAAAPCGGISSCGAVDGVVVISDDGGDADADDH
ncbi:hypothetical protein VOLCADRAFT_95362 [Volvox carteri f. nagariensis]|uniref:Fanconi-associated nuclease n=1 Tax=Volvox carteri f. nagariensis TaxID=3068 RepID=D8U790_VOLCA|nr:uncharacterized protein VOLCADRAFT_95362 [Volvox carteri f. nagariensis]EFJ44381.1 hypothetical protein VOLCADRAFT_95362 [Volvox carteri f. nagariensis]|eukprot:XP_002954488.1 hypothetical protein VOLCADRAFT_95362 [Volvox carteri f. nagariensis]